ncbi:MAG: PEP-CTERM sorting domain-containing protein, partial [Novosphingobium sp.]
MSVRMALAKLAAAAAGGAMLGGGAVHVSEAPSKGEIHHVKPVKVKKAKRVIARAPAKRQIHRARRVVTTTTTRTCEPAQQMAMVPVPYMPPL